MAELKALGQDIGSDWQFEEPDIVVEDWELDIVEEIEGFAGIVELEESDTAEEMVDIVVEACKHALLQALPHVVLFETCLTKNII